jgi:hypothetical protein
MAQSPDGRETVKSSINPLLAASWYAAFVLHSQSFFFIKDVTRRQVFFKIITTGWKCTLNCGGLIPQG